ncbi:IS110 family transposase [Alicyclobacillus suci]|uniref:IS110 family transposase n=1 Tax=Alicyclobacillus suci TaxID=2816080 RepID=UPI001A8C696E|nr:IS110 family transposase [Alicyclobacillus suci]
MSKLHVGIDVSLRSHHVQFMDGRGQDLASFSVHNDQPGADTLIRKVLETTTVKHMDSVVIGMEATSNLGWHLAHYLQQQFDGYRPNLETDIHVLNARKVARFKKGYDTLPKNDRIDAWVIADHLRFGRLPQAMTDSVQFEALQRLTRTRFHLVQSITRDKTFFLNQLFLKFSGLRQDNPFSDSFGKTSLAVIQELEPEQIVQMPLQELIDFLTDRSNNRFENPEETAKELQKVARNSFRLDKVMKDPVNLSLSVTLSVIQHMESEVKKLDKAIAKLMKAIPNTLESVQGIGPVYAAGLLAEIGDIKRFNNHSALAKYAGLVWNQYQSGEYEADETSRMRTGNKYLRYYLIQAADKVRRYDSEYAAFYQKKHDEALKHKHKRALVLTARKLVRLVFTLLTTNQLYTPPERRG